LRSEILNFSEKRSLCGKADMVAVEAMQSAGNTVTVIVAERALLPQRGPAD
jgi:hypothetical protein